MRPRVCEVCAKSYRPTYSKQRTCGRVCGQVIRRKRTRMVWPTCKISYTDCGWCKEVFVSRRGAKYCSKACATRSWHEQTARGHKAKRDRSRVWVAGPCAECGEEFVGDYRTEVKFCSWACWKRSARRRDKQNRSKRIRSEETRDQIGLTTLAKRDGWRCHVCRRDVSRKTWSMDHLVPLSAGGSHTWENVALAHKLCNSKRGTSGAAQLRLVG
jgi:5-methylcytosine-specific restriction endonuclease McrA